MHHGRALRLARDLVRPVPPPASTLVTPRQMPAAHLLMCIVAGPSPCPPYQRIALLAAWPSGLCWLHVRLLGLSTAISGRAMAVEDMVEHS